MGSMMLRVRNNPLVNVMYTAILKTKRRERGLPACSSSPIQNSSKMCQRNKTPGKPLGAHDTIHMIKKQKREGKKE